MGMMNVILAGVFECQDEVECCPAIPCDWCQRRLLLLTSAARGV